MFLMLQDRTGILASLILVCCNATEDEIISDYARQGPQSDTLPPMAGLELTISSCIEDHGFQNQAAAPDLN